MNLVAHRLHVRKFFIRLNRIEHTSALSLPGIIDVDISPAVIDESGGNEGARRTQNFFLIHGLRPAIPAVPAHRRRQRNLVAHDDAEFFLCHTQRIAGLQRDGINSFIIQFAGHAPAAGVQLQSRRQMVGAEFHWPIAGSGNSVE